MWLILTVSIETKISGQNLAHAVMVKLFDLYTHGFYMQFIELKLDAQYFCQNWINFKHAINSWMFYYSRLVRRCFFVLLRVNLLVCYWGWVRLYWRQINYDWQTRKICNYPNKSPYQFLENGRFLHPMYFCLSSCLPVPEQKCTSGHLHI